jgi:hypothetical protein
MKMFFKPVFMIFLILACAGLSYSYTCQECDGRWEIKSVNLFVYYPLQVVYLSYEAYADGHFWLAGICDFAILSNIAYQALNYKEGCGFDPSFLILNGITLFPLMVNSYVSLFYSLHEGDKSKMYRSIIGVALPIVIGLITDWSMIDCVDKAGDKPAFTPVLSPVYAGLNWGYKF